MLEFKKPLQKQEEILDPLASSFLDRLIEVQFRRKTLENAHKIDLYTRCLRAISSEEAQNGEDTLYFKELNEDDKKIYHSIKMMYQNWKNIDIDKGGYVILDDQEIHPSFKVEIDSYNFDFIKSYLNPHEVESVLQDFQKSDHLAYALCLFIFSSGISEKDLLGIRFQDFEPKMRGKNNLLKGLIFTDSGGHVNDKGSSSRIYLLNPFSREKILDVISQRRNMEEVKPSHVLFKGMGRVINKDYTKELCKRIATITQREVNFKTLRGTHARLLYEDIPTDVIGFSLRVELIHSALISSGVSLKNISYALPLKK